MAEQKLTEYKQRYKQLLESYESLKQQNQALAQQQEQTHAMLKTQEIQMNSLQEQNIRQEAQMKSMHEQNIHLNNTIQQLNNSITKLTLELSTHKNNTEAMEEDRTPPAEENPDFPPLKQINLPHSTNAFTNAHMQKITRDPRTKTTPEISQNTTKKLQIQQNQHKTQTPFQSLSETQNNGKTYAQPSQKRA